MKKLKFIVLNKIIPHSQKKTSRKYANGFLTKCFHLQRKVILLKLKYGGLLIHVIHNFLIPFFFIQIGKDVSNMGQVATLKLVLTFLGDVQKIVTLQPDDWTLDKLTKKLGDIIINPSTINRFDNMFRISPGCFSTRS
jgi:hypothetical protein